MKKGIFLFISSILFFINILSAQHFKKDGTPDRRYSENRGASYTPSSTYHSSGSHLKKDGTPDKRFKENRPRSTTATQTYTSKSGNYHSKTSGPWPRSSYNSSFSTNRDAGHRFKRSEEAKLAFMRQTGYPHGRPGYVIDHIIPLKRGGCDCLRNMQWQTIAEAKAKDKWE